RTEVIIEAFRKLRARRDAVLLIYGDGPERARLEASARDLPDVIFLGFERDREKLARALASSDALVHAGPFETFGLVVAEAAAGRLCSPRGGPLGRGRRGAGLARLLRTFPRRRSRRALRSHRTAPRSRSPESVRAHSRGRSASHFRRTALCSARVALSRAARS